jgi:hypothetical protein
VSGFRAIWLYGWTSNLKRTEQDGADKRERNTHRQHIQPQGKVHVQPPSLMKVRDSTKVEGGAEEDWMLRRRRRFAWAISPAGQSIEAFGGNRFAEIPITKLFTGGG